MPPINLGGGEEHPLDGILEDARMNASSDWEEGFCADMVAKRAQYGLNWRPTEAQEAKLREIAEGGGERRDLFDDKLRFRRSRRKP